MLQTLRRVIGRPLALGLTCGLIVAGSLLAGCSRESSQPPAPNPAPPASGVSTPAPAVVTPSRPSDFSLHEPAQRAMPSVVNIFTSKRLRTRRPALPEGSPLRRFFGEPPDEPATATSLGSGVIVTRDGLILTNNHVIEGADEIAVVVSAGRRAPAKVVGADPDTDLAVIKADIQDVTPITFGDSERLQVGDFVLAIGDPFGVGQTVTMGIVSATGRNRLGINPIENFIQTDAPINPGNSGGALVDVHGELVGINSAIYSESGGSLGIGFAIPVSMAKQVMEQLVKSGRVNRGWLGVEMTELAPEQAKQLGIPDQSGALIARVVPGSPAARASLRAGDVVRSLNGKPVADSGTLLREITALAPGQTAELVVVRDGKEQQAKIEVGQRPAARPAR